uniref:hypothetical protein n=1 Tax=Clostridium sp. NkU-1 TaxID=1095009 RepID=UPI0006D066E7
MSLIVGYASKEKSLIMSDGRAGVEKHIEHCDKTLKISNHTIAGFVGYLEEAQFILSRLRFETINNSEDFVDRIECLLSDKPKDVPFSTDFAIIGYDNDNKLCTYFIGYLTGYKKQKRIVDENEPRVLCMGGTISETRIQNIFDFNVTNRSIPVEERLKNTIISVSREDESVNENCFIKSLP